MSSFAPPLTPRSSAPRSDLRALARQFDRRAGLESAQFLYGEVAGRMLERLDLVKLQPRSILDCGAGGGQAALALAERFGQARYLGVDLSIRQAQWAQRQHARRGLARWFGSGPDRHFMAADAAALPLVSGSCDLVWSNLMLHWHPDPPAVLAEWQRVLRVGGLLFFSSFGPDTCRELRTALAHAGLGLATPSFVDMHDFGDMLVAAGFADPVMDQERLCLRYADAQRLLEELRQLSGNPVRDRSAGLQGRGVRRRLIEALEGLRGEDGRIPLTFEVAYGHAWRVPERLPGQASIPVSAIGGRKGGPPAGRRGV
jgi:malonyl-CoA O-methyltransferase